MAPILNIEIGSGMNSDSLRRRLHVPRRQRRRPRHGRRHARVPGSVSAGFWTTSANQPRRDPRRLNGDGNFHFLSEAEAINRDLAISLNRDVEITEKDLGPDGSLEVALGNAGFSAKRNRGRSAPSAWSPTTNLAEPRARGA